MKRLTHVSKLVLLSLCGLLAFASCEKEAISPVESLETEAPLPEEEESSTPTEHYFVEIGPDGTETGVSTQNPWEGPQTESTNYNLFPLVLYTDSEFRGTSIAFYFTINAELGKTSVRSNIFSLDSNLRRKVSSFVVAPFCEISFYTDESYGDPVRIVKAKPYPHYITNLREQNDRYTKIKMSCTNDNWVRNDLCGFAYEHGSYNGARLPIYKNIRYYNFVPFWNDRISSYKALPAYETACKGVRFYEHGSFGGFSRYYYANETISYVGSANDKFSSLSTYGNDLEEGWSSIEADAFLEEWEDNAFTGQGFVVNGTDIDFGVKDKGLTKALSASANCDLIYFGMRAARTTGYAVGIAGGAYFCGGSFLIGELISRMTGTTGQTSTSSAGPSPRDVRGANKWGEFMGKSTRELVKPKNIAKGIGCMIGAAIFEAGINLVDAKIEQYYNKCRTEAGLTPNVGTPISLH